MYKDDRIRMQHMLDAAQEAESFATNRSRFDLDKDRMLVLSLVKDVEIIGEAAARVTENTRAEYPEIPWVKIVGMRNRLIHAYYDIDLDRVWDTVIEDLPPLILMLEKILIT
jgi:uncharacterized protein with HEPN domain